MRVCYKQLLCTFHGGNFFSFLSCQEGTNVEAYKSSHGRNQPFILALGGHFCNPAQTFVVLEHHVLEQKSLVAAVDLCYKIFQIFDLQYPCQARAMWVVMDTIAFDVKPGAQESGAVRAFRAYYHFNQKWSLGMCCSINRPFDIEMIT